jgi:hypothetical protein
MIIRFTIGAYRAVETKGIEPFTGCLQGVLANPWNMRPHRFIKQRARVSHPASRGSEPPPDLVRPHFGEKDSNLHRQIQSLPAYL